MSTPLTDTTPAARFIDPKVLIKIQNLELVARTVVEGFVQGLHRSPYMGFSVDFAAYRQYMPGDEIRRIDWNVFSRSDKLYVKLYEGETNTRVLILLDISGSMNYGSGDIKKIDYARIVAACLSYFAYHQRDGVGLLTFDSQIGSHVPPGRRRGQLLTILSEIDRIQRSELTEFRKPLRFLAEYLTRRGVIVLISDLYDEPENILAGLKVLRSKGNDIIVFHIMDNFELTFPFEDMAQFEDMETRKKLHVIPEYLRTQYLVILNEHMEKIRKELAGCRIDYCLMDTSKPLDQGLFTYLAARSALPDAAEQAGGQFEFGPRHGADAGYVVQHAVRQQLRQDESRSAVANRWTAGRRPDGDHRVQRQRDAALASDIGQGHVER